MPLAKRSATTDLNHDNWDQEEEKEEAGVFKVAPPEEINRRVIKRAVRRMPTIAKPSEASSEAQKNVFGSLNFKSVAIPEEEHLPQTNADILGNGSGNKLTQETTISEAVPKPSMNPFANLQFGKANFGTGTVPSFDFLCGDKNKAPKDAAAVVQEKEVQNTSASDLLPKRTTPPLESSPGKKDEVASIPTIESDGPEDYEEEIFPEQEMPSAALQPQVQGFDEDKVPMYAQIVVQKNEVVERKSWILVDLPCIPSASGIWHVQSVELVSDSKITTNQTETVINDKTAEFGAISSESKTRFTSLLHEALEKDPDVETPNVNQEMEVAKEAKIEAKYPSANLPLTPGPWVITSLEFLHDVDDQDTSFASQNSVAVGQNLIDSKPDQRLCPSKDIDLPSYNDDEDTSFVSQNSITMVEDLCDKPEPDQRLCPSGDIDIPSYDDDEDTSFVSQNSLTIVEDLCGQPEPDQHLCPSGDIDLPSFDDGEDTSFVSQNSLIIVEDLCGQPEPDQHLCPSEDIDLPSYNDDEDTSFVSQNSLIIVEDLCDPPEPDQRLCPSEDNDIPSYDDDKDTSFASSSSFTIVEDLCDPPEPDQRLCPSEDIDLSSYDGDEDTSFASSSSFTIVEDLCDQSEPDQRLCPSKELDLPSFNDGEKSESETMEVGEAQKQPASEILDQGPTTPSSSSDNSEDFPVPIDETSQLVSTPTSKQTNTAEINQTNRSEEFLEKMTQVNICFANWIQKCVAKDPTCILTRIFKDYINHVQGFFDKEKERDLDEDQMLILKLQERVLNELVDNKDTDLS